MLQKDKKIVPNTLRVSKYASHVVNYVVHGYILTLTVGEIEAHPRSDYTLAMLDDDSYYIPDESEPVCTKGLFDSVAKIVQAAQKCHSLQYDENGWNNLVYTPLLTTAVENFKPEERQLIDVAPW